jgi:glycosyltransferase involved in cell wall biosynthesis
MSCQRLIKELFHHWLDGNSLQIPSFEFCGFASGGFAEKDGFMQIFLFYLAVLSVFLWTVLFVDLLFGNLSTKFLRDVTVKKYPTPLKVSIVIPACNEERNIEEALRSVLKQDYETIEFIVINDRSTDRTGEILRRMADGDSRIRIAEIKQLPPRWLGKNHALHYGAQQATGDLLLFTDADIVMHPQTVSKAVTFLVEQQRDHITMAPETRMPTALLGIFVAAFTIFFSIYARPWKAKNPHSSRHIGIGAFNMIRAEVYKSIGGHKPIAMRPDDDLKLGKLIKNHGYRQEFLFGKQMLHVEWYASVRELIQGLEKNSFSGLEYSVLAMVGATVGFVLFNIWPFLAIFLTAGSTQILNLVVVFLILLLTFASAQFHEGKPWYGLGFPIAAGLFVYILWRSMVVTLRNNGITWRGTHYSLKDLKANKV